MIRVIHLDFPKKNLYRNVPTFTDDELVAAKVGFMTRTGMPGIVCALDGTHVAIVQPSAEEDGH